MKHLKNAGFTLAEVMVVAALILILSAVAVPLSREWRHNLNVASTARQLHSDLARAKMEAVRRGGDVAVAFDANRCNGVDTTYTIYLDGNGNRTRDAGEAILVSSTLPAGKGPCISLINLYTNAEPPGFDSRGLPFPVTGGYATDDPAAAIPEANKTWIQVSSTNSLRVYHVGISLAGNITTQVQ